MWSSGHHTGLDFAAPKGTPVRAVHDGTITEVSSGGPLGNHTVPEGVTAGRLGITGRRRQ
ncbi:M23 family metallopeptidase [Streptomyces sp. NBC_00878]|nr:M23 family metallopeptidase [Streptomyces sp. NBC_00878]